MNRLKMIFNLLIGKKLVIYNNWNKEVLVVIGSKKETNKYKWGFTYSEKKLVKIKNHLYYEED